MKVLVALALAAAAVRAQDASGLRARELFYTPPPGAAAPVPSTPPAAAASSASQPQPAPKAVAKKTTPKPVSSTPASAPAAVSTETVSRKSADNVPLGLRYSVLKRSAAGKFEEVDPETTFKTGDRVRFEVQANGTGYLYVVMQGSSGNWRLLFPSSDVASGNNLVHRGETRQIPSGDRGQFFFDEQAGTEKVFFVLSRQPEQDLDKLIYSVSGGQRAPAGSGVVDPNRVLMAQATVGDDVIARLRGEMAARDLIFEKVDGEKVEAANQNGQTGDVKVETAAYVVNRSTAPDARLLVDVSLKHK